MAGEWIKMRTDLRNDPTVFRLAKATKLDRLAVVGRLYALWAWVDLHAIDGRVEGAEAADVDDICERRGFADALVGAGWLVVGEGFVAIPKHDRHNGDSAKERSLKNARQARWRDGKASTEPSTKPPTDVDGGSSTGPSTREEKRREELLTPGESEVSSVSRATRLPHHWAQGSELLDWTRKERPEWDEKRLAHERAQFVDHYGSTGEKRADWDAAWRKWVRGARNAPGTPEAAASDEERARREAEERVRRTQAGIEELRKAQAAPMPESVRALIPRKPMADTA